MRHDLDGGGDALQAGRRIVTPRSLLLAALALAGATAAPLAAQLPAFPGAQGFGARASGGRGGAVLKVTNLNPSGTGSLQWAVNQPGARIVVFAVSGVIDGDVRVPHGNLTIAGQTAPGAGITIHGHLYTDYPTSFGNLVIRHLRVRPPMPDANWPPAQHDTVQFSANQILILDHVDLSHGVDEVFDLYDGARDVTVQWSAITFPVYGGGHPDGDEHNYGLLNGPGGGRISVHHTLFVHNRARTPAIADGPADVRNNVVYNGREGFVHHNPASGDFNLVGNFYRDGPSTTLFPFWFDPENDDPPSRYHSSDNWVDDPGVFLGTVNNPFTTPGFEDAYAFYCCGIGPGHFAFPSAFDFSGYTGYVPIPTTTPAVAYTQVLARSGAWPRDIVDDWAVAETRARDGTWGNRRPADWLEGLDPDAPHPDPDGDGMATGWELLRGLNPADGADHATVMPSGYTAIEEYVNELADRLVGRLFADGVETQGFTRWSSVQP